jgi:hypothetical protein
MVILNYKEEKIMDIKQIGEQDGDIVVEITEEDGNKIKVLLPSDIEDWNKNDIYGLNFISYGHYS